MTLKRTTELADRMFNPSPDVVYSPHSFCSMVDGDRAEWTHPDDQYVVAFGSAGTQKARSCHWRFTKDGTVEAMVLKWIASHTGWLTKPVPVSLDSILEA
jgi:hypothetical protein